MGSLRDQLAGGGQAAYALDIDIYYKDGKYYYNEPNGPVEIKNNNGQGTEVIFPDGKKYRVTNANNNEISYIDSSGTQYTKPLNQAREDFRQFNIVDDETVEFRGKQYKVNDVIKNDVTGGDGAEKLWRDIEIVGIEDGNVVYKTKWSSGLASNIYDRYNEGAEKSEYSDDLQKFTLRGTSFEDTEQSKVTPEDKPTNTTEKPTNTTEKPIDNPEGTPTNNSNIIPTIPVEEVIEEPKPKEEVVPEKERINEMSSRADNYEDVRTLGNDYYHDRGQGNDKATYGAKDRGDVKDQDKALEDIEGRYKDKIAQFNNGDGIIHKGEGIAHHHHQTYTDDYKYGDTDVTYLPGQLIELAGDPTKVNEVEPFRTMYQENIDKNILGDGFNVKDGQKISRIEYAAALASSGKYSMQDLFGTADALGDDKFGFYEGPYFKGTQFEKWAEENKDKDYQQMEEELTNDVKDIIGGWQEVHKLLEEMSGEAVDAEGFYTAQCIQGKFEVAMGNINDRLKPACLAINLLLFNSDASSIAGAEGVKIPPNQPKNLSPEFVPGVTANTPLMEQLKLGEEALNNLLGTGSSPEPINRKQLLEDIDTAQTRLNGWQQELARHGSCPVPSTTVDAAGAVTGDNSKAISAWDARDKEIRKYIQQWKDELEKLNKQFEELEEKIKAFRTELNAILEYSMILLDFIKKYDTYRGTYRSYVLPGANGQNSDIYNWIHSKDIEVLKKNHDAIIHGFEDYDKMPVISNKSDYTAGDVVLYDDAHGYTYVVKGYDPLTGQLIIACIDKDGKQIGSDIIVMDQREITPARQDIFADEYPLPTIPSTVIDSTPDTKPRSTKPHTPVPSTTTPPVPSTTTPPVPSTTTPPEPTPTVIIYTTPPPPPGPTPTPTGPYGPYSPHTGLDAIYGTGETKQSATGLGALAGLAAGAAGLGLTGLIGDKKDEEEEEEEDSTLQMTEENKPLEHVEDKKEETKENDFSDPQFF